jgi:DNA-binding beta-propeller fold protein YncE
MKWVAALVVIALSGAALSATADEPPLSIERTIVLKGPTGRLDHLAIDAAGGRLFVANMANNSLDVVDLRSAKLLKQIPEQNHIQGVAFARDLNRIFVGNGERGECNAFDGHDYKLLKSIPLGDADNVRYEGRTSRVYVAHAEKKLAVIDAKSLTLLADISLPGAPEAFQLERSRPQIFLNTPSPSQVVAIDTDNNKVAGRYALSLAGSNYPLAIDESSHRIFVGCRREPMLVVLDSESGKEVTATTIPADTDDIFFDGRRKRLYVSCGEGSIAVVKQIDPDHYQLSNKIPTAKGARTCLFDPETDRLYLVVPRQQDKEGPEIWVYKPLP